jgi:hypothetical protein
MDSTGSFAPSSLTKSGCTKSAGRKTVSSVKARNPSKRRMRRGLIRKLSNSPFDITERRKLDESCKIAMMVSTFGHLGFGLP